MTSVVVAVGLLDFQNNQLAAGVGGLAAGAQLELGDDRPAWTRGRVVDVEVVVVVVPRVESQAQQPLFRPRVVHLVSDVQEHLCLTDILVVSECKNPARLLRDEQAVVSRGGLGQIGEAAKVQVLEDALPPAEAATAAEVDMGGWVEPAEGEVGIGAASVGEMSGVESVSVGVGGAVVGEAMVGEVTVGLGLGV